MSECGTILLKCHCGFIAQPYLLAIPEKTENAYGTLLTDPSKASLSSPMIFW